MAAILNNSLWSGSPSAWLQSTGNSKLPSMLISPYFSSLVLAYLLLVKALRFRRINQLQRSSASPSSLASMTDEQAWEIQKSMAQLEFPFLFEKSLQFALFRVRCF